MGPHGGDGPDRAGGGSDSGRDGRYGVVRRRDFVREERRGVGRRAAPILRPAGQGGKLSGGRVSLAGARSAGRAGGFPVVPAQSVGQGCEALCQGESAGGAPGASDQTGVGPGNGGCGAGAWFDPPLGGGDAAYGSNHAFTTALEDMGETFLMDVACKLRVWENDPGPQLPPPKPGRKGRPRKRDQAVPATAKAVRVDVLTTRNFATAAREVTIRDATKGPLHAKVWVRPVWVWDGKSPAARQRLLIVRQEADGTFKYALEQRRRGYAVGAAGLYASAAFLDRTLLSGRQERIGHGAI